MHSQSRSGIEPPQHETLDPEDMLQVGAFYKGVAVGHLEDPDAGFLMASTGSASWTGSDASCLSRSSGAISP